MRLGPAFAAPVTMADQPLSNSIDSRLTRNLEAFAPRGPAPERGSAAEPGRAAASQSSSSGRPAYDEAGASGPVYKRRQPRADDDVHYTTSPFATPGDRPLSAGEPIDPADKRGLVSRTAGVVVLGLSAVFAVAALVLTATIHIHLAIPLALLAAGLVYVGRRMLRQSSHTVSDEPADADPGRRRAPDMDD